MHLVLVCLLGFADTESLIADLDHPDWQRRQAATKQLSDQFDYGSFVRLEAEIARTKKPEVKHRCQRLIRQYYRVADPYRVPPIWCLPKSERFNNDGDDLAKEYWQKAKIELNKLGVQVVGWRDDDAVKMATVLLLTDMLHDPKKFKLASALRKKMSDLEAEEALVFSQVAFAEDGFYDESRPPPPAIEEWIEKGRANKGKNVPLE